MAAAIGEMIPTPLVRIRTDGKKNTVLIITVYEFGWWERELGNALCGRSVVQNRAVV